MEDLHPWFAYTSEILSFAWQGREDPPCPPAADPAETGRRAPGLARLAERARRRAMVLLGLGRGGVAEALDTLLPPGMPLLVCDLSPEKARCMLRAGRLPWRSPAGRTQLLADASPWALAWFLASAGAVGRDALLVLNPELDEEERRPLAALQRALAGAELRDIPAAGPAPDVSAAAILHPDEPGLPGFLGQFPGRVRELCLVFDADAAPPLPDLPGLRVNVQAHPLDRDFAAQRNRALSACAGQWVLSLDADETLPDSFWPLLPGLAAQADVEAWHLPRLTWTADPARCRAGYGLWPDLQLRLFRNRPGVRYERPVHERLAGAQGPTAILLDRPILHGSRLRKSDEELRRRLSVFDQASGGGLRHTLNPELPGVLCGLLYRPDSEAPAGRAMILPEGLAG